MPLYARVNVGIFWLVHASALMAFALPVQRALLAACALSYLLRMLGITMGFHRYFAHGAFDCGRAVRFLLALAGTAAMQKGPIWWAGTHVLHHRSPDREGDPHSPVLGGFYHAHMGWFLDGIRYDVVDADNPVARRFSRAPEIRLLDRLPGLPPIALAVGAFAWGGWPGLVWGFSIPTVLLAHATFSINSVTHMFGSRRFDTSDDSRNNPWTALATLGEGWHNNHHRYPRAARNGFVWWELDVTYLAIRGLERLGLAWNVRPVPAHVLREVTAAPAGGNRDLAGAA
jgi:stearoyl-CoA desaturase (delta-9 desaturase)